MSNAVLTENEERLFGAAKEAEAEATQETKKQDVEELKKKYMAQYLPGFHSIDKKQQDRLIFIGSAPIAQAILLSGITCAANSHL